MSQQPEEIKRWLPFTEDDLKWIDGCLMSEYFSYPEGLDGDVLRQVTLNKCIRLKRNVLADELKKATC